MKTTKSSDEANSSVEAAAAQPGRRIALQAFLGAAAAAGTLTQASTASAAETAGEESLAMLDKMAVKPTKLSMRPRLTYLGGPTYLIEIGRFRIISDPGFDPQGTQRNEGPGHLLTKVMAPPIPVNKIGRIDFALVSHAQHLDNLECAGRPARSKGCSP